jgi:hypothetical protein
MVIYLESFGLIFVSFRQDLMVAQENLISKPKLQMLIGDLTQNKCYPGVERVKFIDYSKKYLILSKDAFYTNVKNFKDAIRFKKKQAV